ncbi:mitochondrial import inner membrane translocase subunit TIM17-3-like isoform X2 [Silene latifolia]|uniref:mitochondrial import inner membrane translocase subunit TIM17-3-like isoform X2 n=1 Tax=Silene latifolia TaxID=37657 RepID=UPI003D774612
MRTPAPPSGTPCPYKIIQETGLCFAAGLLGGTAYHFIYGARTSPRGHKLLGAIQTMRMNAPRTAARLGTWGALYGALECGMHYLRHKKDPWNSTTAAAVTCGLFEVRRGVWPVVRSAVSGAGLAALFEGSLIFGDRLMLMLAMRKDTTVNYPKFPAASMEGGAAGGGGEKEEIGFDLLLGEVGTKVLESFDTAGV